jgi:hypothetical protein
MLFPHPNPSPEAHRRRLPPWSSATSPRTAPPRPPLAKLSLPLGSPDPPHAKATTHCPRIGPPAVNRRRAHRRPGFSPADSRFAPPSTRGAVPPPPLRSRWRVGPRRRRHPLARPRRHPPWAAAGPVPSRTLRLAGPEIPPGPPVLESLFFFLFPTFSPLISIFSILYAPKIIKMISKSHVIIMLEMTHYN